MTAQAIQMSTIEQKADLLESVFNQIYRERMHDVPIINTNIEVSAVDFQPWQDSYIGVLITPWFMNLMLLPGESENWDDKQELSTTTHRFPSGNYEFLTGFEPDIGKYQMCSLFSPMFDFADNNAALETAQAVIKELMNVDNVEETDINSRQIEDIWNGVEEKPGEAEETTEIAETVPVHTLSDKIHEPMSRRKLLRGALLLDDDANA